MVLRLHALAFQSPIPVCLRIALEVAMLVFVFRKPNPAKRTLSAVQTTIITQASRRLAFTGLTLFIGYLTRFLAARTVAIVAKSLDGTRKRRNSGSHPKCVFIA